MELDTDTGRGIGRRTEEKKNSDALTLLLKKIWKIIYLYRKLAL